MRRHTINSRQLEVLRRIADGEDPVTSVEPNLAVTVYALLGRGLVMTSKHPGGWVAEVTEAGRFYLAHGQHPEADSPPERVRLDEIKQPSISARQILERLQSDGGAVVVPDPDWETRAAWRRAVHALRAMGLLPNDQVAILQGRSKGDLRVSLEARPADDNRGPRVDPVAVPARLSNPHPVVKELLRIATAPRPRPEPIAWGTWAGRTPPWPRGLDVSRSLPRERFGSSRPSPPKQNVAGTPCTWLRDATPS
jgi:hypothetical protein